MPDFDANMDLDMADVETNGGLVQSVVFQLANSKRRQTVPCIIGDVGQSHSGTDEGLLQEDNLSITVRNAAFVAAGSGWIPGDGSLAIFGGVEYRIRNARQVPGDVVWTFDLVGADV
jgi:hypothetical protein